MVSLDARTRPDVETEPLDVGRFIADELPERLAETGHLAARGQAALGLADLAFSVDGHELVLTSVDGRLVARPGGAADAPLQAVLDTAAFSELMADAVSTFGLQMTGRVALLSGQLDDLAAWEPVLRAALDARPVHEPGMVQLLAPDGAPLDPRRSFSLGDPSEELGWFLAPELSPGKNRRPCPAGVATPRAVFSWTRHVTSL